MFELNCLKCIEGNVNLPLDLIKVEVKRNFHSLECLPNVLRLSDLNIRWSDENHYIKYVQIYPILRCSIYFTYIIDTFFSCLKNILKNKVFSFNINKHRIILTTIMIPTLIDWLIAFLQIEGCGYLIKNVLILFCIFAGLDLVILHMRLPCLDIFLFS